MGSVDTSVHTARKSACATWWFMNEIGLVERIRRMVEVSTRHELSDRAQRHELAVGAGVPGQLTPPADLRRAPRLVLGIGDDCAIFRPARRRGSAVHDGSDDRGRALSRDPQARGDRRTGAGAQPERYRGDGRRASLLSGRAGDTREARECEPSNVGNEKWIEEFYRGLLRLAKRTGTALAGGDLAHSGLIRSTAM